MKNRWLYKVLLLLAALIWGFAFVAQSVGMEYVGPFTFNAIRMPIASLAVWIYIRLRDRHKDTKQNSNEVYRAGIYCGICLFLASSFQQIGIQYTTSGKAGFLTALYIVLVPILGIFLKKKTSLKTYLSVLVAIVGMYLLCVKEGFSINYGDLLEIAGALLFSMHILVIDHYAGKVDGVKMSCIQFLVCGLLSIPPMLLWETVTMQNVYAAAIPILYAGLLSGGVAYTLQIVGQAYVEPTEGSLLLSMESVFAAVGGFLILHEVMSGKEFIGCLLIFSAVIITQLPNKKRTDGID